jgi:phage host-nuclease inhibitor protein Gam
MKKDNVRIIAVALSSREDAARVVRETVQLQLKQEEFIVVRDKELTVLAERHNAGIDKVGAAIAERMAQLQQWAAAHPEEFVKDARSLKLDGHTIGWKLGNHATKLLKGWTWKKVVTALEATRKRIRDKYLRTVVEPNKEAMISDRRHAKMLRGYGVEIIQGETFYMEPNREGQADTVLTGEKQEARGVAAAA